MATVTLLASAICGTIGVGAGSALLEIARRAPEREASLALRAARLLE